MTDATDQTPERPDELREGDGASAPEPARPKHRWELRIPASTPPGTVIVTPWYAWPADCGPRLGIAAARPQPGGRLALRVEGCESREDGVAVALEDLDLPRHAGVAAWQGLPSSPHVRFRAELDPFTPVGEVLISAEPAQQT